MVFFSPFTFASPTVDLTVEEALQKALKNSYELKDLSLDAKLAELEYKSSSATLFLPNIYFEAKRDFTKNIQELQKISDEDNFDSEEGVDPLKPNRSSEISLTIEDINLLNTGRDYITRKILKITKHRDLISIENQKRIFLHSVYQEYFKLKLIRERMNASNDKINIIKSFIESSKSRSQQEDLLTMKGELSEAIKERISIFREYRVQKYAFNIMLNEPLTTKYNLSSDIPQIKNNLNIKKINYLVKSSPIYREVDKSHEIASLGKKLINRDVLPYFNLSVGGLKYGTTNDNSGTSNRLFDSNGTNYLNISASVGIRISIWGEDGFASSYTRQRSSIEEIKARYSKELTERRLKSTILSTAIAMSSIEQDIEEIEKIISNKSQLLDIQIKRFLKGNLDNIQIRETLNSLTQTIFESYDKKLEQIETLVSLSNSFDHENAISKTVSQSIRKFRLQR